MIVSDLSGRTTVVVGASRGLGRGIARAFAEAGAPVVAVARTGPALAELATTSANIRTEVADAADATVAWSLLDQYEPEVLILVAGANPAMRPLQFQTWETFSVNWHTDVKIAFSWLREALLKPLPPGSRVVVVSSGAAINGSPASGGYAGSKATQRFIAGYAHDESRRAGLDITVTAVLPRMTPLTDVGRRGVRAYAARGDQTEEAYLEQLGELLTPERPGPPSWTWCGQTRRARPPGTCSPGPGCRSCHERRRGTGAHRSRARPPRRPRTTGGVRPVSTRARSGASPGTTIFAPATTRIEGTNRSSARGRSPCRTPARLAPLMPGREPARDPACWAGLAGPATGTAGSRC